MDNIKKIKVIVPSDLEADWSVDEYQVLIKILETPIMQKYIGYKASEYWALFQADNITEPNHVLYQKGWIHGNMNMLASMQEDIVVCKNKIKAIVDKTRQILMPEAVHE